MVTPGGSPAKRHLTTWLCSIFNTSSIGRTARLSALPYVRFRWYHGSVYTVLKKSSQNTRTILRMPQASWDGRIIRTLDVDAFRSSQRFDGEGWTPRLLPALGLFRRFLLCSGCSLFSPSAAGGGGGGGGSLYPALTILAMGLTST